MFLFRRILPFLLLICLVFYSHTGALAEAVSFPSVKMWKQNKPVKIRGTVSKPKGQGPFPAIVLLPNCGGPDTHEFAKFWPKYLNELGYVTLNVDPFTPRNQKRCSKKFKPKPEVMMQDAYGAYAYMAQMPDVDASRVGVLGSSLGAHAINWYTGKPKSSPDGLKFSAAVSLYPAECKSVSAKAGTMPTIIILGDKERGIAQCQSLQHPKLNVHVLPGVYHGFDQPSATRKKNGSLKTDIAGNKRLYDKSATQKAQSLVKEFLSVTLAIEPNAKGETKSEQVKLGKVGGKDPYMAVNRRDSDSDGKLSSAEWDKSPVVFSKIDTDGDGFLTPQEFHAHWLRIQ